MAQPTKAHSAAEGIQFGVASGPSLPHSLGVLSKGVLYAPHVPPSLPEPVLCTISHWNHLLCLSQNVSAPISLPPSLVVAEEEPP